MVQRTQSAANQLGSQIAQREVDAVRATDFAGIAADEAVADRSDVRQPGGPIPQGPVLHLVQAGELITAQYINDLVLAVQNLQTRVHNLEALVRRAQSDDSPVAA
ncbi:MAG: hypothetical protein QOI38_560 [Sphingomonadales bacterium]|jgi:hypothetical protein|nr:hypothetical protein [Sphingomonadales bacterium]